MSNVSNNKPAREYRARLETTASGVLLCHRETLRQAFGGQKLGVNVSRAIEATLEDFGVVVYPPLHREAKDLIVLALKDAGSFKTHPELFEGDDPYEIAQRVMEQGFTQA